MTVVTKAQFAAHIGVSRPAVTKMCNSGRIPVRPDGKINLEEAVVAYESTKQVGREASKKNGRKGGKPPTTGTAKQPAKRKPKPVELDNADGDDAPLTTTGHTQQQIATQYNKAKLAKETYTAKLKELEYKKARGELLDLDEVREDAKKIGEDIRGKLFAIAPKLAPVIVTKTPREAQRMIEDAINKALTSLHKSRFTKEH